jgi:hypothetical protein
LFAINIIQAGVGVEVPDVVHQAKVPHVEPVSGKKIAGSAYVWQA